MNPNNKIQTLERQLADATAALRLLHSPYEVALRETMAPEQRAHAERVIELVTASRFELFTALSNMRTAASQPRSRKLPPPPPAKAFAAPAPAAARKPVPMGINEMFAACFGKGS